MAAMFVDNRIFSKNLKESQRTLIRAKTRGRMKVFHTHATTRGSKRQQDLRIESAKTGFRRKKVFLTIGSDLGFMDLWFLSCIVRSTKGVIGR